MGPSRRAETLGLRREQGRDGYREVVEEIITALSRIRWLFVIARNSSFTYKGQAIDVKQVERKLGVRSVSSKGQFRKVGARRTSVASLSSRSPKYTTWRSRPSGVHST